MFNSLLRGKRYFFKLARTASGWPAEPNFSFLCAMKSAYSLTKIFPEDGLRVHLLGCANHAFEHALVGIFSGR